MSEQERAPGEVTQVDEGVLRDLASRYASTLCPVHGVPPQFSVDDKGGVVEVLCCEALAQIFRERQETEEEETVIPE